MSDAGARMKPSKEAINVRLCRLGQQLWGRGELSLDGNFSGKPLTREIMLDALTTLYDECNKDGLKKNDAFISAFIDKYRSVIYELKQMRVNVLDFEIKDLIGRGHFGEVNVVKEKHTGDVFAMKTLKKETTLRHLNIAYFEEERDIMALSKSNWLVQLQYAFQDSVNLYLIMEYCPGGDLAGLLERRGKPLIEKDAIFYVAEMIEALKDLHSLGFIHRDVKPDNVFLDRCGHLKLGDFGSAARLSSLGKKKSSTPIGTTEYISPEILMGLENPDCKFSHGISCDYWSLGIVAYELVTCSTPFKSDNKSAVQTYKNIMEHANKTKVISIKYPKVGDEILSEEFKNTIKMLLHPVPEKRPTYEDLKRNKLFRNTHWKSLREQVPPFVPIINSQEDTSNFLEIEKQKPALSSNSFQTKSAFTGKDLPFIGFTYAGEIKFSSELTNDGNKITEKRKDSGCNSSGESTSSNPFLNSSMNGTAICTSNKKEMEALLESRKKEIDSLHKKIATLLSKQTITDDNDKKWDAAEKQKSRLEKDLSDMLLQNQKLQHQLESEHKKRSNLENQSLQLIRDAKGRWKEKTEKQISALNDVICQYETQLAESNQQILILESDLNQSKTEISNLTIELEAVKKLQHAHKDNMAKARRLSRQSIIGIEQISQESNMQLQTLTQNLRKEIELKNQLDLELKELKKRMDKADEAEADLKIMLHNEKRTFTTELMLLTNKYDDKCQEVSELLYKVNELNDNNEILKNDYKMLMEKEKREKSNKNTLNSTIAELENKIKDLKKSEYSLKSTCQEKTEQYDALYQEKLNLECTLKNANKCEEKHRERVAALEELLSDLQMEVDELSKAKLESSVLLQDMTVSTHDTTNIEKIANLEEQITKLQEQLKCNSEETAAAKKDARKADLALWKKEKELENSNLDLRITTKDLKKAEEKISAMEADINNKQSNHEAKLKELQSCLNERNSKIDSIEQEIESLNKTITTLEDRVKSLDRTSENENKRNALSQQKYKMEIQSLTEKNESLQTELKSSEERRSKAEKLMESSRQEMKDIVSEKCNEKEQRIRLEVMFQERYKEHESLQQNYKMLQETCTILEEQLMDFENVTETLDKTNEKLKEELSTLKNEMHNSNVEQSKIQKMLDIQKFSTITAEVKLKENEQKVTEDQTKIMELENQITELLSRESVLVEDINGRNMEISQLGSDLKQSLADIQSCQSEIIHLKEECTRLLTDGADLREDNMRIQLELKEYKEKNASLHNVIKEQMEEMSVRQFHWQQREMKAEATISQHIKLIDFLQMKVEELSKRKKTIGDMLFGKSSTKENIAPPLTPQTPLNRNASMKIDHKELQQNKELRERVAFLESKLKMHEIKDIPKCDEAFQKSASDAKLIDGAVKIQKGAALVRVNMKLFKDHLEWKGEKEDMEGKLILKKDSIQLVADLTTNDSDIHLSDYERKSGFKITSVSLTTCWPSQSLLIICSSTNQKEMWLQEFYKCGISKNSKISTLPQHKPKSVVQFPTSLMEPACVIEIEKNLLLIGAHNGLYSFSSDKPKNSPIAISHFGSVIRSRIIPQADTIVMLFQGGNLQHCSLRQLIAILKSAAISSIQPSVLPNLKTITFKGDDDNAVNMFEVSHPKKTTDRIMLCASTSAKLVVFSYDSVKMTFVTLHTLKTDTISCMRFTPHTIIVASHKFYEIDLESYIVEEFLDPSDLTLSHAIYAHKKNIFPIAIVQTKEKSVEKCNEYLLCFSAFGIFVDEYGQRSRKADVKWSHLPLNIIFRKPFLFIIHFASVEIIHLEDNLFQDCDSDSDSDSASSTPINKKLCMELNALQYLGKSMTNSSIYIKCASQKDRIDIMELNGNLTFKKQLGESIDTLNTIDDNDSCKSLKVSQEKTSFTEADYTLSEDSSVDIKTDFAAHIREKARVINSLKRENHKIDVIKGMLSGQNRKSQDLDSSGEESDLSSSYGESSSTSRKTSGSNNIYTSMNTPSSSKTSSLPRTTSDIVQEMFISNKKQVRFNK